MNTWHLANFYWTLTTNKNNIAHWLLLQPGFWHWYDPLILFGFHQFYGRLCVYVCMCVQLSMYLGPCNFIIV